MLPPFQEALRPIFAPRNHIALLRCHAVRREREGAVPRRRPVPSSTPEGDVRSSHANWASIMGDQSKSRGWSRNDKVAGLG